MNAPQSEQMEDFAVVVFSGQTLAFELKLAKAQNSWNAVSGISVHHKG